MLARSRLPPDAHNASDTTNFRIFTPGVEYSLKWGNGNTTSCAGDAGFDPSLAPSGHGFVDLGQGNGTSAIDQVNEYGGYPNSSSTPSTLYAGEDLGGVPGNKGSSVFSALAARSDQDSDETVTTIAAFEASLLAGTANGCRIVTGTDREPGHLERKWQQRERDHDRIRELSAGPGSDDLRQLRTHMRNLYWTRGY